jgi:hypothetical protein
MKEYFDLGRGHEQVAEPVVETGCQVCNDEIAAGVIAGANDSISGYGGYGGGYGYDHPQLPLPDNNYLTGGGTYQAQAGGGAYPSQVGGGSPSIMTPARPPTVHHEYEPPVAENVPTPQEARAQHVAPTPPPQVAPLTPPPTIEQLPPPPPAPIVAPPPEVPRAVPPQRKLPPPPSANTQRPVVAPGEAPQIRTPSHATSFVLQWAAILTASLLMIQIVALVLRPVRRAIALRHFAQPFWDETVAQRVSNAWQLALVGLRDAGWRTSSHESPAAFAKRVKVEGLERCATILERARHGIGIDRDDLADMTASAETAYRSARAQATPAARAVSWMRWPLV